MFSKFLLFTREKEAEGIRSSRSTLATARVGDKPRLGLQDPVSKGRGKEGKSFYS